MDKAHGRIERILNGKFVYTSRKGEKKSEETKAKMRASWTSERKAKLQLLWTPERKKKYQQLGRKIGLKHLGVLAQKNRPFSEETRKKLSVKFLKRIEDRTKCPHWYSDRTQLKTNRQHAYDSQYREWMRQVKNRDYWKCQISNDDCSGRVEAHHILGWRDHPELRYEIKNGITLCHFHHPRRRMDEERYATEFQQLVAAKMQ
jgi:hypothetical protein